MIWKRFSSPIVASHFTGTAKCTPKDFMKQPKLCSAWMRYEARSLPDTTIVTGSVLGTFQLSPQTYDVSIIFKVYRSEVTCPCHITCKQPNRNWNHLTAKPKVLIILLDLGAERLKHRVSKLAASRNHLRSGVFLFCFVFNANIWIQPSGNLI